MECIHDPAELSIYRTTMSLNRWVSTRVCRPWDSLARATSWDEVENAQKLFGFANRGESWGSRCTSVGWSPQIDLKVDSEGSSRQCNSALHSSSNDAQVGSSYGIAKCYSRHLALESEQEKNDHLHHDICAFNIYDMEDLQESPATVMLPCSSSQCCRNHHMSNQRNWKQARRAHNCIANVTPHFERVLHLFLLAARHLGVSEDVGPFEIAVPYGERCDHMHNIAWI